MFVLKEAAMKTISRMLLISGLLGYSYADEYGVKFDSLPRWEERAVLTLVNACRMAPIQYRDSYVGNYSILLPENHPAVNPIFWELKLNLSARFFANDMAHNCGYHNHSSCDGTIWDTRIKSFYTEGNNIGENIASGYASPQQVVAGWIYDRGAADKTSQAGHRTNIMNRNFRESGVGYASGAEASKAWVHDFGNGRSVYTFHPIPSASHLFLQNGYTTFMASYYDSSSIKPSLFQVFIDGGPHNLELEMGDSTRGTYSLSLTRNQTGCRAYYFVVKKENSDIFRYPESGCLLTYGESGCTEDYDIHTRTENNNLSERNLKSGLSGLSYTLAQSSAVMLEFFDLKGSLLFRLYPEVKGAGTYHVRFPHGKIPATQPVLLRVRTNSNHVITQGILMQ